MRATLIPPVLVFFLGAAIALYVSYIFQKSEEKSQLEEVRQKAQEYSRQLDMSLLNSILRVQGLLGAYDPDATKILRQRKIVEEIIHHTIFQRISIFKRQKDLAEDGLPKLKRIYFSRFKGDTLPLPDSPYLTSDFIRSKILAMEKSGKQSAFTINHSPKSDTIIFIWHFSATSPDYALFLAPIDLVFPTSDYDILPIAQIHDPDTKLKLTVGWDSLGHVLVLSDQSDAVRSALNEKPILKFKNSSGLISLEISWFYGAVQSYGTLPKVIWFTGIMMALLLASFLRFILDQNRKVADLVVMRTIDLESALDQAKEANQTKMRFLANISHELRTPLNLILGMVELVEEKNRDPRTLEHLGAIRTSGDHLLNLINDLLQMAQKDREDLTFKKVPIKCPIFFEEIGRLVGPECKKAGLSFRVNIAPDIPEYLFGDPARLRQILLNLLRNSLKYTVSGFIELIVEVSHERVANRAKRVTLQFSVRDSGVGIPKSKHQQIFERFLQLDSSKVLRQGGVGLGLSIVKDLVERMGGNIQVISEVGVGSMFTVELDFESVNGATPWVAAYESTLKYPVGIALVSDDSVWMELVKKYLKSEKIHITAFSRAEFQRAATASTFQKFEYVIFDGAPVLPESLSKSDLVNKRVLIVGDDQSPSVRESTFAAQVIDNSPLLPTSLWRGLGAYPDQLKNPRGEGVVAKSAEPTATKKRRDLSILVADDDVGNRNLLQAYFEDLGWRLVYAENGQAAFDHFKKDKPDVIVADLRMPVMDGFEMTDRVRAFEAAKNIKKTPIILVTADALDETAELARKHDVTSFLTKPVRKSKMIEAVYNVVD